MIKELATKPLGILRGQTSRESLAPHRHLTSPPYEQEDIPAIRGHMARAFIHLLLSRRAEGTIATNPELEALHEGVDPAKANILVRQEIRYLRKRYGGLWNIYSDEGQGYGIRKKGEGYTTLPDGKKIMLKKPTQAMTLNSIIAAGEQGISIEILAQPYTDAGSLPKSAKARARRDIEAIKATLGPGYDIVNLTPRGARHLGIKFVYAFKILGSPTPAPRCQ